MLNLFCFSFTQKPNRDPPSEVPKPVRHVNVTKQFIVTHCLSVVYYESINREIKRRLIYEYRCDERLKTKNEESTLLEDTGLVVELGHLKTKTRLIDEKFVSVRGERKDVVLTRIFPTLDLNIEEKATRR